MNSVQWLKKLISFNTISSRSNLELIENIEGWLKEFHIESSLTYDLTRQKANLFATIPAKDNVKEGGLILSGHTDVVPVEGQDWHTDPFKAHEQDGRIYGRGACDMKGFIAVVLGLIPKFCQITLSKPLHLAFSYDEEVGCLGAPFLIEDYQKQKYSPYACIVGEPTEMRPLVAHKGIQVFHCKVQGKAAHSSLTPAGCNAIEHASHLIYWIRNQLSKELKEGPLDSNFDVPHTSITTNTIYGGIASNIIPDVCEFFFEFRNLPTTNPDLILNKIQDYINQEILPKMHQEHTDAAFDLKKLGSVPAFESSEDAHITQLIRRVTNEQAIQKASYATEAGLFQKAGVSTILCGPGSIKEAHRPNEFVTIEQLNRCEQMLKEVVTSLA